MIQIHIEGMNMEDIREQLKGLFANQTAKTAEMAGAADSTERAKPAQPPNQTPPAPVLQQPYPANAIPVQPPYPAQAIPAQQPQPVAPPVQTAIPTRAPSYDLVTLSNAARGLMDSGRANLATLQGLLTQFGVTALTELKPEQYPAYAQALRQLGASV